MNYVMYLNPEGSRRCGSHSEYHSSESLLWIDQVSFLNTHKPHSQRTSPHGVTQHQHQHQHQQTKFIPQSSISQSLPVWVLSLKPTGTEQSIYFRFQLW